LKGLLAFLLIVESSATRLAHEGMDSGELHLSDMGGDLFKRGIMKMRIGKRGFDSGYEDLADDSESAYVYIPEGVMRAALKRAGIRRMRMG
uniref:Secreted protein n=1 Tax=Hydatigena taeniaeformis TaxID=6205 RepID=A0A0R3WKW1_HYDTA